MRDMVRLNVHGNIDQQDNTYGWRSNYQLLRVLGKGGFATTYLGQHRYLRTKAAIKVLHIELTDEEIERFLDEAYMIAHLEHRHIVRVLDFNLDDEGPFLVMEYAPFGTLRHRYPAGTQLSLTKVVRYVKQIASALQHIHNAELIHRDLKPENLLVAQDGRILLSDFGIAAIVRDGRVLSTTNGGTIPYMAPESFYGHAYFSSDQYALGIIVYEWLCGERPFQGTSREIAWQHLHAAPPPLHALVPTIPPTVEAVVLRALAKHPNQRFPSVQAFAQALEDAVASAGTATYASQPIIIPRRASRVQASTPTSIPRRTSQQRGECQTSFVPARTKRRTAMTSWKEITKLFGLDLLAGSTVFVVLSVLGIPTQSFWFFLFLCLGSCPLLGALAMRSQPAFLCASSIFLVAAVLGIGFHSQVLFATVYATLLLLCWLVSLAITYGRK